MTMPAEIACSGAKIRELGRIETDLRRRALRPGQSGVDGVNDSAGEDNEGERSSAQTPPQFRILVAL